MTWLVFSLSTCNEHLSLSPGKTKKHKQKMSKIQECDFYSQANVPLTIFQSRWPKDKQIQMLHSVYSVIGRKPNINPENTV